MEFHYLFQALISVNLKFLQKFRFLKKNFDSNYFISDGPRERPRLQLAKRTAPVETEGDKTANSAIFGGAKPVDTTAKEREIEEKLKATENAKNEGRTKKLSERSSGDEERAPAAPSKNIFGNAKPVDTTKREREIEEKLRKVDVNDDNKEPKSAPKKIEKRENSPPAMKKAEEKKPPVSF